MVFGRIYKCFLEKGVYWQWKRIKLVFGYTRKIRIYWQWFEKDIKYKAKCLGGYTSGIDRNS